MACSARALAFLPPLLCPHPPIARYAVELPSRLARQADGCDLGRTCRLISSCRAAAIELVPIIFIAMLGAATAAIAALVGRKWKRRQCGSASGRPLNADPLYGWGETADAPPRF